MKIDWFTTLVRHFANVANASDQPTYIGLMRVCWLGVGVNRGNTTQAVFSDIINLAGVESQES